jgi:hypothetical protein
LLLAAGMEQIVNFNPSWPRNAAIGEDLLDNPSWQSADARPVVLAALCATCRAACRSCHAGIRRGRAGRLDSRPRCCMIAHSHGVPTVCVIDCGALPRSRRAASSCSKTRICRLTSNSTHRAAPAVSIAATLAPLCTHPVRPLGLSVVYRLGTPQR